MQKARSIIQYGTQKGSEPTVPWDQSDESGKDYAAQRSC